MKAIRNVLYAVASVLLCATILAGEKTPDRVCFKCHADKAEKMTFEDGAELSIFIDAKRYAQSVHGLQAMRCVECHTDVDVEEHPERELKGVPGYRLSMAGMCVRCHEKAAGNFADDIHRDASKVVLCTDCHGVHYALPPSQPRTNTSLLCGQCHEKIEQEYSSSAHGAALLGKNNPDVPICTDCHRAHGIEKSSTADFHLRSVDLCKRCHGDAKKMKKYGLSTDVMQTYLQDFHGVSVSYSRKEHTLGSDFKATCVDCHGAHSIPRKGSPESLSIKANLVNACRKCHPKANEQFSDAWLSHYIPSPTRAPAVFAVKAFYWLFIPFVIVGLCALVVLDFVHLIRSKEHLHMRNGGPSYIRFSRYRRAEHALLVTSFLLLLLTGFPQKFNDHGWAEWLIMTLGGMDQVRVIHRFAGFVFSLQAVGHILLNVLWLFRGRIQPDMLAEKKDFTDALNSVKLALGLQAEKPKAGRYDFRQKFEYWGMLMGGMVMVVTGFILLFPVQTASILPGQFIAAAKIAHSFEAVMAMLVIVVWHLYCSLLRPGTFPLDTAIFTGKISRDRMREEHPLEYEQLQKSEALAMAPAGLDPASEGSVGLGRPKKRAASAVPTPERPEADSTRRR